MTAMPQRIAISHAFGALAATLVGIVEYYRHARQHVGRGTMVALGFEVLFGSLTVTGSLMAFGKLQELAPEHSRSPTRARTSSTSRCSRSAIGLFVCAHRRPGRTRWSST